MGSKFVEKHKRKSILAALLLIFQGRTKYVSIMVLLAILSVPFVISGETLSRMLELGPVASFLRTVGLGSVVSTINPKYSNDLLRAAMDKAAEDSAQNSYWAKFLKSINATMPANGGPSSLALLRGGGDDIFGPPELKDGKYDKRGAGQVKGAVNEEEKANGQDGGDVDLQGLLAGVGAGQGGMNGDIGQNFGGGAASDAGPYMNRTMFRGPGGTGGGRGAGIYNTAMNSSGNKVPVPGSPAKVRTKLMGRVSGFTWKNVGYKTASNKIDIKLNSKKPMFQLAQTFGMTGAAVKSKESALEYQASYTGSTYDGNDANLDIIQTDAAAPSVPDTAFTGDLIKGTMGIQQAAKECSEAQGDHGAKMSDDGKKMDDISKTLGKPPKCCSSGVGAWNGKIDQIISYCQDFNVNEAQLSAACQNTSKPMDCSSYASMKIKKCSKWKCWLSIILAIFLILIGIAAILTMGAIGVLVGAALIGGGLGLLASALIPGMAGMIIGMVLGGLMFFSAKLMADSAGAESGINE